MANRARSPGFLLWVLALAVTLGVAYHQRRTGPSRPRRVELSIGEETVTVRLPRTEWTTRDAIVAVPDPGPGAVGEVRYRRHPTDDPLRAVPMARETGSLVARLPAQPPAGKLAYHLVVTGPGGPVRLPAEGEVVIRFKGEVPAAVLAPHVALMLLSLLLGARAGLGALRSGGEARLLSWATLLTLTAGGMILGPIVQKLAFGAFWAGWPLGKDLTDNKTLVMWAAWLIACVVLGMRARGRERAGRVGVVAAAVVMLGVYLVPHSLLGSELDYDKLDRGVPASEAVETG